MEKIMENTKDTKSIEINIHIPEKVDSAIKQQKINHLYDLLVSKKSNPDKSDDLVTNTEIILTKS